MTAARAPEAELAPLLAWLQQERELGLRDDAEARVLGPLLQSGLHGPLAEFLARPGKEFRARLCERAFAICGGEVGLLPLELPLIVEILHAGSLIVDDIEDDSDERRGAASLHRLVGMPVALNAGNWLYFWPQRLIARSGLSAPGRLALHERMGECLLRCHEGQALDLTVRIDALPRGSVSVAVHGISERKTGALMGLASGFGAIAAGAPDSHVAALERFGAALGVGLQMLDDLSGALNAARADKGREDLLHGRATWTWAWLAEDLDSVQYADWLLELGRARTSALAGDDRELVSLMERLRFRLGVTGPRRARRYLERAVAELSDVVGAGSWLRAVTEELRWLERRFMEA